MSFFGLNTNTVAGRIGTSGGRSPASAPPVKQRLFANPARPASFVAGGASQTSSPVVRGINTLLSTGQKAFAAGNTAVSNQIAGFLAKHGFRVTWAGKPGAAGSHALLTAQQTAALPPKLQAKAAAAGLTPGSSPSAAAAGGIGRPGGSGTAGAGTTAPADTGAGVVSAFQAYEDEINMPRTAAADSGFVSLKSAGWQAPFQWWWQSFASKYAAEETSHAPPASAAATAPVAGGATPAVPKSGATSSPGKTRGLQPQVIAALAWARAHGWHGTVISGFRTFAQQQAIYNSGVRPAAVPGTSMHEKGLAVDVSDPSGFERALANAPASAKLFSGASFGDPNHFSTTGH